VTDEEKVEERVKVKKEKDSEELLTKIKSVTKRESSFEFRRGASTKARRTKTKWKWK
jgi:hypothetical protein